MTGGGGAAHMATATIRLRLGDCISKLKSIEAGTIGAIITDPPYG